MGKVNDQNEITQKHRWSRFGAIFGGFILLAALPVFSQTCSLCYTQAASSGTSMIAALKSGILILIVPPTLGSIGMIFVVSHKLHQFRYTEHGGEYPDEW